MQKRVQDFVKAHGLSIPAELRYLDLVSEVGELGKAMLLDTDYGKAAPKHAPDMALEAGDCLFSLIALCEALGIDAEAALQAALAKYQRRFAEKGSIGSTPQTFESPSVDE